MTLRLVPTAHKKTRPLHMKWPGKNFNESATSAIANVGEKRLAPPAHGFVGALERHDCVNTELEAVICRSTGVSVPSVVPVIPNLGTESQVS